MRSLGGRSPNRLQAAQTLANLLQQVFERPPLICAHLRHRVGARCVVNSGRVISFRAAGSLWTRLPGLHDSSVQCHLGLERTDADEVNGTGWPTHDVWTLT